MGSLRPETLRSTSKVGLLQGGRQVNTGMEYEDVLMRNQEYAAKIKRQAAQIESIHIKVKSLEDELEGWFNLYFNYRAMVTNKTVEEAQDDFFKEAMDKIPVIDPKGNKIMDELFERELEMGMWDHMQFRDSIGAPREGAD